LRETNATPPRRPALTYCLGILLPTGLLLASDSRSNAGVDQVVQVCKLATFVEPGQRVVAILSAGNRATSQAVVSQLREDAGSGDANRDVLAARTLMHVAELVGARLREIIDRDQKYVDPYGDVSATFLVGGQIKGEAPRLFEVYAAGNFIEATPRSPFLQIGETKYGKPILDRALTPDTNLAHAAKLALLSFDATLRSNISVGLPIDMLQYQTDSFSTDSLITLEEHNPYWRTLRQDYSEGLAALVDRLPPPPGRRKVTG
jgi:putative proteasome-type protease